MQPSKTAFSAFDKRQARARYREKTQSILRYTAAFGLVDIPLAAEVISASKKTAQNSLIKLENQGLLRRVDLGLSRIRFYILTKNGATLAHQFAPGFEKESRPPTSFSAVTKSPEHDLLVARLCTEIGSTIDSQLHFEMFSDRTIRRYHNRFFIYGNIPDAIIEVFDQDGEHNEVITIEVQQSSPKRAAIERTLGLYAAQIHQHREPGSCPFSVIIASTRPRILDRYSISDGMRIQPWRRVGERYVSDNNSPMVTLSAYDMSTKDLSHMHRGYYGSAA